MYITECWDKVHTASADALLLSVAWGWRDDEKPDTDLYLEAGCLLLKDIVLCTTLTADMQIQKIAPF